MSEIVTTHVDKKEQRRLMSAQPGCDTCRYCGILNTVDKTVQLICRRKPPVVSCALIMGQNGPQWASSTAWPGVDKYQWCGEFAAKEH